MELVMEIKKEEMEAEKKRLMEVRSMTAETKEKIKRLEDEHAEQKSLHQKKIRNIRNNQSAQETRLNKLTNDIRLLAHSTSSRRENILSMERVNEEGANELKKIQDVTNFEVSELKKRLEELEAEVKQGYVDLQNEKEVQVLLEVGLSNYKSDERLPLNSLEEIVRKRQECTKQRQKEINAEINQIENDQLELQADIDEKQENLMALKTTHADLLRYYKKNKF